MGEAPGIFFLTTFWGGEFRLLFSNFCLPSLLSPHNLPALKNKAESRFVIATPQDDWEGFCRHPIYEALKKHIAIQHVLMENPPAALDAGGRMRYASIGNKLAAEEAFKARSYAMIVAPDVIFSDGSVSTLQRRAIEGFDVVLALGLRTATEPTLEALSERGLERGKPLTLSGRDAVRLFMQCMHSETHSYRWDEPYYAAHPTSTLFRVKDEGFVVHSLGWTPIFGNYGAIREHRTATLDGGTIDGLYFQDNFAEAKHTIVDDSDELMQLSLTQEAVHTLYPLKPDPLQRIARLREAVKLSFLRNWAGYPFFDGMKRQAFRRPVRLHVGECGSSWDEVTQFSQAVVSRALRLESRRERFLVEIAAAIARPYSHIVFCALAAKELIGLVYGGYLRRPLQRAAGKDSAPQFFELSGIAVTSGRRFNTGGYSYISSVTIDGTEIRHVFVMVDILRLFDNRSTRFLDGGRPPRWKFFFTTVGGEHHLYAMQDLETGLLHQCSVQAAAAISRPRRAVWAAMGIGILTAPLGLGLIAISWAWSRLSAPIPTSASMYVRVVDHQEKRS